MGMKFANNAAATLSQAVNPADVTINYNLTSGATAFPALGGGDYFWATMENLQTNTREVVKVTAAAGQALTVVRGQDGTVAGSFSIGDKLELRVVAAALNDIPKLDEANVFSQLVTMSLGATITGGLTLTNSQITFSDATTLSTSRYLRELVNKADNGTMQVTTRLTAPNLSTVAQVGKVDRFMVWASGGAVTGGTITQDTAATIGRTGNALHISAVTLTGAGVLSVRQRLRSERASQLKNATGVWACQVLHDVGANVGYTAIIRKANALNNFGGVTVVVTSAVQQVATATGTQVSIAATALGDISNGVEIELQIACGAVAGKNFRVTDWQFEEGLVSTPIDPKPYGQEQQECAKFLPAWTAGGVLDQVGVGQCFSGTQAAIQLSYTAATYVPPTGVSAVNAFQLGTAGGGSAAVSAGFTLSASGTRCALLAATVAAGLVAGNATTLQSTNAASQILLTGAEI